MKVSFNWLKDYVRVNLSAPQIADRLTQAGLHVERIEKVSGDTIFETEVTTNRPDWLSHLGVAREIHAVTGCRFVLPPFGHGRREKSERSFRILLPDPDLCPYYSATLLENVEWAKTPDYMKHRLEACGIRLVNLIVDITNYVLLEWGQPLHAFDADRLRGDLIRARRAQAGESIVAIDGTRYKLTKDDLVIADTEGPVAIGGVMGGKESEVDEGARHVLLESAFFKPSLVRATRQRLGLSSESSYRFERRVDPRGVDQARERAVDLISKYACPKRITRAFRAGKLPIREVKIVLERSEVKRILGLEIPKTKLLLSRLGLKVSGSERKATVLVPSFRNDLTRPIDLIEELARLYGYERIPETLPELVPVEQCTDAILDLEERVRDLCVSFGLHEAITFSLVDSSAFETLGFLKDRWTRLVNPQNQELNLMRPTLLAGLLEAVRRNLSVGETEIRLFEVGSRYLNEGKKKLPVEEHMLAAILSGEGKDHWLDQKRALGFYDVKGIVEELLNRLGIENVSVHAAEHSMFQNGQSVSLNINGRTIGFYGTLSDRVRNLYDVEKAVYYAEVSLDQIASRAKRGPSAVQALPKFPPSPRDLTLILDEGVKAEAIIERIRKMAGHLASRIEAVDYFKGGQVPPEKKSLCFRIFYQAPDRTLQNEEVNRLHFSIIDSLTQSLSAELPRTNR